MSFDRDCAASVDDFRGAFAHFEDSGSLACSKNVKHGDLSLSKHMVVTSLQFSESTLS